MNIHPTAIISPDAEIDNSVEIGPYCTIYGKVKIGAGTKLHNNVTIYTGVEIGENNVFFPYSTISTAPQDLKFKDEVTGLKIGNNNTIREYVTISRATSEEHDTVVGSNNLFMANSHVAHDCIVGSNCIFANSVAIGGHSEIHDFAILGGLAGVHQFCKVGAHCMIGAMSYITKDVPPFTMFSGNPARNQGLNSIGLSRRGFSPDAISQLKEAYKLLFHSGLNRTQAVQKIIETKFSAVEVQRILEFIEKSNRGIYLK